MPFPWDQGPSRGLEPRVRITGEQRISNGIVSIDDVDIQGEAQEGAAAFEVGGDPGVHTTLTFAAEDRDLEKTGKDLAFFEVKPCARAIGEITAAHKAKNNLKSCLVRHDHEDLNDHARLLVHAQLADGVHRKFNRRIWSRGPPAEEDEHNAVFVENSLTLHGFGCALPTLKTVNVQSLRTAVLVRQSYLKILYGFDANGRRRISHAVTRRLESVKRRRKAFYARSAARFKALCDARKVEEGMDVSTPTVVYVGHNYNFHGVRGGSRESRGSVLSAITELALRVTVVVVSEAYSTQRDSLFAHPALCDEARVLAGRTTLRHPRRRHQRAVNGAVFLGEARDVTSRVVSRLFRNRCVDRDVDAARVIRTIGRLARRGVDRPRVLCCPGVAGAETPDLHLEQLQAHRLELFREVAAASGFLFHNEDPIKPPAQQQV